MATITGKSATTERIHNSRPHRVGGHCGYRRAFNLLNFRLIAIALTGYFVNQSFLKPYTSNAFVHGYLNDILAMLVLLPYCDLLLNRIRLRHHGCARPLIHLAIAFAAAGYWEFITPIYLPAAVSDMLDFLAYSLGTLVYLSCRRLALHMETTKNPKVVPQKSADALATVSGQMKLARRV